MHPRVRRVYLLPDMGDEHQIAFQARVKACARARV
jgi:hypothetical protein